MPDSQKLSIAFKRSAAKAVRLLGGSVEAARRLNVGRYQTVQSWTRNRIPPAYCPAIEKELGGLMRCEEMRPDIPWGVLRSAAPAEANSNA